MKKILLSSFLGLFLLMTFQLNAQTPTGTQITKSGTVSSSVTPFPACPNSAYQVVFSNPTYFEEFNLGSGVRDSLFVFPAGYTINSIGYNQIDSRIYGIRKSASPSNLMVIGANNNFQLLTTTGALIPSNVTVGDINSEGTMFISEEKALWKINLDPLKPDYLTVIKISGSFSTNTIIGSDMAFAPGDNINAYSVNPSGDLVKINTTTLALTVVKAQVINTSNIGFGAIFFDNEQSLYASRNDGKLWKIFNATSTNPNDISSVLFSEYPGQINELGNDGARCPNAAVPPYVRGTVYIDKNGTTPVNSVFTLPATQLYAQLVNSSNVVLKSVPVSANGNYEISLYDISGSSIITGTFSIQITMTPGTATPSTTLPTNYVHVSSWSPDPDPTPGDGKIPFTATGAAGVNITGVNFGIEQRPVSDPKNVLVPVGVYLGFEFFMDNRIYTPANYSFPPLTANDHEDGALGGKKTVNSVQITTLPTNAILKYNGVQVTQDQIINNYDSSKLSFTVTVNGGRRVQFSYNFLDAAGKTGEDPALYTIDFPENTTLPVHLSYFTVKADQENAQLHWSTSAEQNNAGFGVEHSVDGNNWNQLAFVNSKAMNGNSSQQLSYQYIDKNVGTGSHYYRLKQTDLDGNFTYSDIAKVDNNSLNAAFKVYPNPTSSYIYIEYSGAVKTPIRIMDMNGRMVKTLQTTGAKTRVATNELAAGTYVVSIDGKTQKFTVNK